MHSGFASQFFPRHEIVDLSSSIAKAITSFLHSFLMIFCFAGGYHEEFHQCSTNRGHSG